MEVERIAMQHTNSEFLTVCEIEIEENTLDAILQNLPDNIPAFLIEVTDLASRQHTYTYLGIGNSLINTPDHSLEGTISALEKVVMTTPSSRLGKNAALEALPFYGGVVGFIPYQDATGSMPSHFFRTDRLIVQDHRNGTGVMIAHGNGVAPPDREALNREFQQFTTMSSTSRPEGNCLIRTEWEHLCDKSNYLDAVRRAKSMIEAERLRQVVISLRLACDYHGSTYSLYRSLRRTNTAPQNFYLRFPSLTVLGTPPSTYLEIQQGDATLDIGAGTRPVTGDLQIDERVANELSADLKERLEHTMLVDEAVATLSRVGQAGTVHCPVGMEIRRFSHVMHLFTVVRAMLEENRSALRALLDALPPTPVVGVPVHEAVNVIAELENTRRGPYGGIYLLAGFDGNLQSAIVERSMWIIGSRLHLSVGAGITADSVPEIEYAECLQKAEALMKAVERVDA